MDWIATTAYGLEGVLAQELRQLGLEVGLVQTSRVAFAGGFKDASRANIFLRTAGQVRLVAGSFPAVSFEALFEGVRRLPWADYLPEHASFPVTARCVNSTLMSVSDCQSITKKAVAESLRRRYRRDWFPEDGPTYPIEVHLWKDVATLSLAASGAPLHQRGYRRLNGPAALRETLAAALVLLSHWRGDRPFWDPFCGTGTIAIEAALYGRHIAPGMHRSFGAQAWPFWPKEAWEDAYQAARDGAQPQRKLDIAASDVSAQALSMAGYHVKQAGMSDTIALRKMDVRDLRCERPYGHIITNPPYGQRLGDQREARELAAALGRASRGLPHWSCHVISADPQFERSFGRRAAKRRVLYNGPLACRYFQYFGPRPPRPEETSISENT